MSNDERNWRLTSRREYFDRLRHRLPSVRRILIALLPLGLIAIISIWLIVDCVFEAEIIIRWFGMSLQLLGFGLTVFGINNTFHNLELRSIPRRIYQFLKVHLLLLLPITRIHSATVDLETGVSTVKGYATSIVTGGTTVEERLAGLEKNQEQLRIELSALRQKASQTTIELNKSISRIEQDIDRKVTGLKARYDGVFEGGLVLECLGIIAFCLGVVLASASPEIALTLPPHLCETAG